MGATVACSSEGFAESPARPCTATPSCKPWAAVFEGAEPLRGMFVRVTANLWGGSYLLACVKAACFVKTGPAGWPCPCQELVHLSLTKARALFGFGMGIARALSLNPGSLSLFMGKSPFSHAKPSQARQPRALTQWLVSIVMPSVHADLMLPLSTDRKLIAKYCNKRPTSKQHG